MNFLKLCNADDKKQVGLDLCRNHLEERLLDQAQERSLFPPPPFFYWGSFAQHTPRHDIGCLTPCKIIIMPDKAIPQWIF